MEEFSLLKPTTDFIFKRIFGNEEGKVALISLLNAILNGDPVVKDLKFLNTEILKEEIYSKASRLDVEVTTDNGTIVNIEIQCVDTGDLESRSIVYASQLVAQYTRQGQSYDDPNVISIWIIRDNIRHEPMTNKLYPIQEASVFLKPTVLDKDYTKLSNKMRIIFVLLSKFKEEQVKKETDKMMQDWAQFFENPSKVENKDGGMKEAQYIWMKVSGDDEVKARIKAIEKYERDKGSELATARKQGLIEGEKKKMKELALNMKNQGFEDTIIAKCLDISMDELYKLINKMN